MKIIVAIKQVPLRDSQFHVNASGKWIEETDLTFEINEPDAYALEEALQLKEKHGAEVVALCAGPARAAQTIREALAKGADRAIHIETDDLGSLDTLGVAKLLAAAAAAEKPDLILTGLQSDDLGAGQTGVIMAELLGMPQFPDQSCINRFLHELGSLQSLQLERISEALLHRFGLWRRLDRVDLDIDSTGLMVYGHTYEGMRKGYFPRQRGRRGYRLTVAATANPADPEILALAFDPANVQPAGRLWDCLYQAADVLGSLERLGVVRADAAFGTGADVQELLELGVRFIVKGMVNQTAINFAARVSPTRWESLDLFRQVYDLGPQRIANCRHPVRVILVKLMTRRFDRPAYSHLYTNLGPEQADAAQLVMRYDDRQCIEALFKSAKYGLAIDHLRTKRYRSIEGFLHVAAITFNLLSWFRFYLLAQAGLGDLGMRELAQTLMDIPAKCSRAGNQVLLSFPARHPLAPALARL